MVSESQRHHQENHPVSKEVNVTDTAEGVKSLPEAAGFLVLFRLWRVVRIANGKSQVLISFLWFITSFLYLRF